MRRYWIDPSDRSGDVVQLKGDVFHHVCDVCRQDVGDRFEILCGDGQAYLVELKSIGKRDAQARVLSQRMVERLPKPHIHLALSIPRFAVFDAVLEKSVELGVATIHPFVSQFSHVRDAEGWVVEKRPRWEKIVRGATQQCGRGELMPVDEVRSLNEILKAFNRNPLAKGLFAYEGAGDMDVRSALSSQGPVDEVWVFVGSEGGFSPQEVEIFRNNKLLPVTLGPQVLRVETACVALVSVIKYELGLMK